MSSNPSLVRVCYVRVEEFTTGPRYTVIMVSDVADPSTERTSVCRGIADTVQTVEAFLREP
jgi:hypothetical protein